MTVSFPSHDDPLKNTKSDTLSTISLLNYGLRCLEQGRHTEGLAFFRLARERLLPQEEELSVVLDALDGCVTDYIRTQQLLHIASKNFAASTLERERHIELLQQLLVLRESTNNPPNLTAQQRDTMRATQTIRVLHPLHSPAENAVVKHSGRPSDDMTLLPTLYVTCFNRFEVRRLGPSGHLIELCRNQKGQAIFRYLVAHPKQRETVDMLMAAIWPEEDPEGVLHKLQVAISALRRSLNKGVVEEAGRGYILYRDQTYQINPEIELHSDAQEFVSLYRAGFQATNRETAMTYYERACALHTGPFLAEDLYVDWSFIQREELNKMYVTMCDTLAGFSLENGNSTAAIWWATAILKIDRCDESAYRQLIRAYMAEGRRSEAVRQYQQCQRVLHEELSIQPAQSTQRLFTLLLNNQKESE